MHAVEAVDLEGGVVLGELFENGDEFVGIGIQVLEVGRLRGIGHHENDALVFVRRQFRLAELEQHRNQAQHDHREHQHHRPGVEGAVQHALVTPLEPVEQLVEAVGQPGRVRVVAQEQGAHHGRQGQGDDAGDHHGARQGQGELLEQRPGQPRQETDRRIHGGQGDGHRDHRHGDFPRALERCVQRGLAFLDMAVDVLHHDDGVIHHQADGQHHGQQGQQVDRVAHQLHEKHHADHRQRNGHHRDHHRTQGAEEQEHHDNHDQHGFEQGFHHLVDRRLDKQRGVVGDFRLEVGRQLGLQLRHQLAHFLDHVQRVGPGRWLDPDVHRGRAAKGADAVVVFRAHFHASHVAEQHPAVAIDFQRDLAEGFGGFQFGVGVDAGDHVLALDLTGGRQKVVLAHRAGHVAGAQAKTGKLDRVQPQAHGKDLVAEDFGFGHAGQGRKLGLDHARQVVGDLRVIQLLAEEADVHQHRGVRRLFAQHRVFGVLGQLVLDLVGLGQQLGEQPVAVGTDARVDRDHREVLAADRGHVVDAFGTGQALLQGLGDIALDGFGVGPGVRGGHRDQGVFHLWVLAQRQLAPGLEAQQHDQQADHGSEHRATDERVGKSHGDSLISQRVAGCSVRPAGFCPG